MSLDQLDASRRRGGFAPKENIPLQIDAYDKTNPAQHLAVGTRLDTGEQIQVFLLPDPKAAQRTYARAEIADFAKGPRDHKSSTDIGGAILFEKAQQVKPGVYSSEWATVLSHTADEAQVLTGLVRVDRQRGNEGNTSQKVELLHNNDAKPVNSPAELKQVMEQVFASKDPGVPGVYLRVDAADKEGNLQTKAYKVGNTFTETVSAGGKTVTRDAPEVAYQKFLDSDFGKTFMSLAGSGELKNVEAIPVSTLYVGKDSLGKSADLMAKNYQIKGENGFGFAESSLAVRQRDNGSFYATLASPLRTDKDLFTPETAPTQNRAGEPAPVDALDGADADFDGAALEAEQAAELAPLEAAAQQPAARSAARRFG